MASRRRSSTTGSAAGPSLAVLDSLPVLLKLLLAQAVYQQGTDDWKQVAVILKDHPSLAKTKPVLKADTAKRAYQAMMAQAELPMDESYDPGAVELERVAVGYYEARLAELEQLMQQEADKFRAAYTDLNDIQTGKWDDRRPGASGALPDQLPPLLSTDDSSPSASGTKMTRSGSTRSVKVEPQAMNAANGRRRSGRGRVDSAEGEAAMELDP